MVNHPNRSRRRYEVWHAAGMSDDAGVGYFGVAGPRVNEFELCDQLADVMEKALNRARLSPRDWKVIRSALAFVSADEHPDADAARALLAKL